MTRTGFVQHVVWESVRNRHEMGQMPSAFNPHSIHSLVSFRNAMLSNKKKKNSMLQYMCTRAPKRYQLWLYREQRATMELQLMKVKWKAPARPSYTTRHTSLSFWL